MLAAIRVQAQFWLRDRRTVWALAVLGVLAYFYALQFTQWYLPVNEQMVFSWVCLLLLWVLTRMPRAKVQPWRGLIILVAGFIALRYLVWRTTDTLIYTGPLDFVGLATIYLAELYAIAIYFLGMMINAQPEQRQSPALPADIQAFPSVDVFIPTYNESDEVIRVTVEAARQIDYPRSKLNIWILDDGGTVNKRSHPETGMTAWMRHYRLRRMANDLGVNYLTRSFNDHAKAGNINHALQHTQGDLVLILDCDHVPTQDILQRTVGFFLEDPKLFLVQTPHFFLNATPTDKNLSAVANIHHESDMFYRRIQPGLDFWNAAYFCGSAAVLSRRALDEIGGLSGKTITEDAETAFHLHGRGYNSVYLARPMVCGLSPETYNDFVIQRTRWAQGMLQLLILSNPLTERGLTLPQRLAYLNSSWFWLFSLARITYFLAPSAFLLLGLNVYNASYLQILVYALPYMLSTFVLMHYFYGDSRVTLFSEVYEGVQTIFLLPALIGVMVNPHKPAFQVTPKGSLTEEDHLSPLATPFVIIVAINFAALAVAGYKWVTEPIMRDVILVTGGWCIYNLYLGLVSLGTFWERRQIRSTHRIDTTGEVKVVIPRLGTTLDGSIRNISLYGMGFIVKSEYPLLPNERVHLETRDSLGRLFHFEANIRRAVSRDGYMDCGAHYVEGLTDPADVVRFVYGDSERWQRVWESKEKGRKTLRMLLIVLVTGMKGFYGSGRFLLGNAWRLLRLLWSRRPMTAARGQA